MILAVVLQVLLNLAVFETHFALLSIQAVYPGPPVALPGSWSQRVDRTCCLHIGFLAPCRPIKLSTRTHSAKSYRLLMGFDLFPVQDVTPHCSKTEFGIGMFSRKKLCASCGSCGSKMLKANQPELEFQCFRNPERLALCCRKPITPEPCPLVLEICG